MGGSKTVELETRWQTSSPSFDKSIKGTTEVTSQGFFLLGEEEEAKTVGISQQEFITGLL